MKLFKFVSRVPIRTCSLELRHITYYIIFFIALEKCKNECNVFEMLIILVQAFAH